MSLRHFNCPVCGVAMATPADERVGDDMCAMCAPIHLDRVIPITEGQARSLRKALKTWRRWQREAAGHVEPTQGVLL